ncbi:MAG: OprO/OprP family phosphate-selective porin, partial [Chloroflexi bacterium]|nr:OprO/OprP family phosphate-selective porin [Chloroflexota bacterium]
LCLTSALAAAAEQKPVATPVPEVPGPVRPVTAPGMKLTPANGSYGQFGQTPIGAEDWSLVGNSAAGRAASSPGARGGDETARDPRDTRPESAAVCDSSEREFHSKVTGYRQIDAHILVFPVNNTAASTFEMRRFRVKIDTRFNPWTEFLIAPNIGRGRPVLKDVYINLFARGGYQWRIGKFKTPLSLERLQSSADLQLIERSIADNIMPNRDIGVQVSGDVRAGIICYALGLFHGVHDGGSNDGEAVGCKNYAARLFLHVLDHDGIPSPLRKLGFGIGVTTGNRPEFFPVPKFKTATQTTFFKFKSKTGEGGTETRVAPQFSYYFQRFGAMGEYVRARQRIPQEGDRALTFSGYFLQAAWTLTGEPEELKSISPAHPFHRGRGGTGALEVAARFSSVDLGGDAFNSLAEPAQSARRASEYTVGLNWYPGQGVKAQLDLVRTEFGGIVDSGLSNLHAGNALMLRFQRTF